MNRQRLPQTLHNVTYVPVVIKVQLFPCPIPPSLKVDDLPEKDQAVCRTTNITAYSTY